MDCTEHETAADTQRREVAKHRWKLLFDVLSGKRRQIDHNQAISVRRFSSFGLLQTLLHEKERQSRNKWYKYTCPRYNKYDVLVRHLDEGLEIESLVGFNNTGNICVWPAEEILTYYSLKYPHIFTDKSVCEIGGGMTCLAGLAVGMCTDAKDVLLTDGNDKSVQNVEVIIERNKAAFGGSKVSSRMLRWDEFSQVADLQHSFDIIICADCYFFDKGREDLIETFVKLLKSEGQVISFAPSRGETFNIFAELSKNHFSVGIQDNYDDMVWELHQQNLRKGIEVYDENIHYPRLMKLTKIQR